MYQQEEDSRKTESTGIPRSLQKKAEEKSGFSFEDVRVHYNSARPADFGALAYTAGNQIYIGPGQERHLPHELGHVVQQKEGRVNPTTTMKGWPVNDEPGLEKEADQFLL